VPYRSSYFSTFSTTTVISSPCGASPVNAFTVPISRSISSSADKSSLHHCWIVSAVRLKPKISPSPFQFVDLLVSGIPHHCQVDGSWILRIHQISVHGHDLKRVVANGKVLIFHPALPLSKASIGL